MKYIPLVQVCDFQGGSQPPKDQWIDHEKEGYIRMLQIRDFTQPDKDNVEFVRISKTIKTCNEDDILIGRYGASVGKILTGLAGAYNVAIIKTIPDTSKLSKRFLYHYLNSPYFQSFILSVGSRAAQAGFNKDDLSDAQIPDLSLEDQSNIVSQLDKVSGLISLRKEQLAKLDQLVKSRFIELFGATSAENCTKQIKDYAEVLGGYAFKSDLFCSDAIPVIRISNINNGCVELDYNICFDELFWEQNKRFRVEQNDVLMAMSGATTGKAGVYRENMPALINQRVACIRAKDGVACPTFLFVATQLEWMYDLIQETSAGCAQPNISGKQIENMPVPDASYEQQQQFASFVEQTDKSKLAIQESLAELETLKKALLQKYFG